jgi:hypothetical protein
MVFSDAASEAAFPSTLENGATTAESSTKSYKTPPQVACSATNSRKSSSQNMSLRSLMSGNNASSSWSMLLQQQKQPQGKEEDVLDQFLDLQPIFDYFLRGPDAFDLPSNELPALRSLPTAEERQNDFEPFHLPELEE